MTQCHCYNSTSKAQAFAGNEGLCVCVHAGAGGCREEGRLQQQMDELTRLREERQRLLALQQQLHTLQDRFGEVVSFKRVCVCVCGMCVCVVCVCVVCVCVVCVCVCVCVQSCMCM